MNILKRKINFACTGNGDGHSTCGTDGDAKIE